MQEGGSQLGLPQALVRWGQQRRGPWWLEVVKGSLLWGHPGLGLGEQKCGSEAPVRRPLPTTKPLAQKVLRACLSQSFVWGLSPKKSQQKPMGVTQTGAGGLEPLVGPYSHLLSSQPPSSEMKGLQLSRPRTHVPSCPPHPKSHRRWVKEEAPQLGIGPRVLGPKDRSRRERARSCSGRALGSAWGGLGSTLGLGLPYGCRGPHSALRLGLRWTELELMEEMRVSKRLQTPRPPQP